MKKLALVLILAASMVLVFGLYSISFAAVDSNEGTATQAQKRAGVPGCEYRGQGLGRQGACDGCELSDAERAQRQAENRAKRAENRANCDGEGNCEGRGFGRQAKDGSGPYGRGANRGQGLGAPAGAPFGTGEGCPQAQ